MSPAGLAEAGFGPGLLRLALGDITTIPADALVNAANEALAGGGGVDGAVHRAGGPSLMEELAPFRARGGCPTGSAVLTGGGLLPVKWVVHAVGPVWRGGHRRESELLASAYESALALAAEKRCGKVTLAAISTGVYGYPLGKAAQVALGSVAGILARGGPVREAVFVLFGEEALAAFSLALAELKARS